MEPNVANIGNNIYFFDFTMILLGVASMVYLVGLYSDKPSVSRGGTWICLLAALSSFVGLGLRWVESYQMGIGRIPVTNLYESLVFFAWAVVLFHLFVERKYH